MSHTNWRPAVRCALTLGVLVPMFSAGAPLFAQQIAAKTQAAVAQAPQAPAGPTLELTMAQAVTMALETNLGLKRDRMDLSMAAQGIAAARAAFLPSLTGGLSHSNSTSVPTNHVDNNTAVLRNTGVNTSVRWAQSLPWYGSSYNVNWTGTRSTTNAFTIFNPSLGSQLTLTFNQPLWQRLAIDNNRFGLDSAQRSHQIADLQLQQEIWQTQDAVRMAYLNLVGAVASLEVANENKKTNDQALANARARIAVGSAAEIDAIQSEAAVLSSEEAVIIAEASVSRAEDALRTLIVDNNRPDFWTVHIVATDEFKAEQRQIDVDAAIKNALDNRLDLQVTKQSIALTQANQRLIQDSTKPSLDFQASYSARGSGGTLIDPNTLLPVGDVGFGSVFGDAFGNQNPAWTLGLQFGYPIGQTTAKVNMVRQQLQLDQLQLDVTTREQSIVAQVRDAARQVESGWRRVQSTQAAVAANEKQLEAENRKLAVGMSTTFDILQKQQLLAAAKNSELAARIAYNQALITFDRVQRTQ